MFPPSPRLVAHMTPHWRQAVSNHRSREGGDRRLRGLIRCSREFPRCRLFRLSGAEVHRRNSDRIGGFEKGEFERNSARKEVAAQICVFDRVHVFLVIDLGCGRGRFSELLEAF
jgi:hypothetical protein